MTPKILLWQITHHNLKHLKGYSASRVDPGMVLHRSHSERLVNQVTVLGENDKQRLEMGKKRV